MTVSVMGILNLTPDSFSDGGRYFGVEDAVAAGLAMVEAGASYLDLGAESTRPGASPVDPGEERARLMPALAGLRGCGALLSIDTRNAATMRACLDAGANVINDVSALRHDPASASLLAGYGCPVVLMHSRGSPTTMAQLTQYDDVVADVIAELQERIGLAMQAGIARSRLLVDPGIGFAKNTTQNLELLRRIGEFAILGCRVVLGTSRKRFIGEVAGVGDALARGPGSLASSLAGLVLPDVILRVHDVAATVQGVRVWQAIQG